MQVTNVQGEYDLILYGLGVMGENFIRNFARNGYRVIGVNRTVSVTERFAKEVAEEDIRDRVGTAETLVEACEHLKDGGAILAMIKANDPVLQQWGPIDDLFFRHSYAKYSDTDQKEIPALVDIAPPDTVFIDAANSHPRSTKRRCDEFTRRDMLFIGTGVSGGAEGALKGPSIMPGGMTTAYARVGEMLEKASAHVDGVPCCTYMGDNEAGHFVKNVHNGIEYAIMQAISEVYFALSTLLNYTPSEIEPIFAEFNEGRHGGYLMEISTEICGMADADTGQPMLDVILDRAGQKGTGKWTSQIAFDLGVPVPSIAGALQARIMSSFKDARIAAADVLEGELGNCLWDGDAEELVGAASDALYGAMVAAYAQGFWLLSEASSALPEEHGGDYDFSLDLDEIAKIWRGGCIIRSVMLEPIREAFAANPDLHNMMLAQQFAETLNDAAFQANWRRWVNIMVERGLPKDAIGTALNFFDTYRTPRLPANMIQAQRDRFGEHGFERTDRDGKGFHLNPAD